MPKCLFCYKELNANETDFHKACSKQFFGTATPPLLTLNNKQLETLAKEIIVRSIAVTGVQPKLSLQLEKTRNETPRLTLVGLYGDYILKPPSEQYPCLPENEDLTMHLAQIAGIRTAAHSLIRLSSGELAYITRRFDRQNGQKIAVEDFCQLTETLTEHKYRGSVEKIGKLVRQFTTNTGYEQQRLFELVLFCYLTGNTDMHLKNYALIENPLGQYELSPAYDLLSTLLVLLDEEESALTINGKKNHLKCTDFDNLAKSLQINEKTVTAIYQRFAKILPTWQECIERSFLSDEMKKQYSDLIIAKLAHFLYKITNKKQNYKK
jgi:hypothetical protein